jgi:hypothetical protein
MLELAINSINAAKLTSEFEIINRIMSQSSLLCRGPNLKRLCPDAESVAGIESIFPADFLQVRGWRYKN